MRAAAKFPQARIRGESPRARLLAERLEAAEQRLVAHTRQTLVDKHLRRGEDDAAINVVLRLKVRQVADAHRAIPLIALQIVGDPFIQRPERRNAVHRLKIGPIGRDRRDVAYVVFHGLGGAQTIQRVDDEISVTKPAVAIIPVARRRWSFRDRRRQRSDDRARLFETAEFQRDRGADHRRLPFEGNGQVSYPAEPIIARPLHEFARRCVDPAAERVVLTEDEGELVIEREGDLLDDVRERRVGGQAHHLFAAEIADVIGAEHRFVGLLPIVARRPHADGDARQARQRLNAPDDLRRTENALEALEARREVGDAQHRAAFVGHDRLDDCGIANIVRFAARHVRHHDVREALLFVAGQQAGKHRIAVKSRKAPPDDARLAIHERRDPTIAYERKVEVLLFGLGDCRQPRFLKPANSLSHARTSAGPAKAHTAPARWPATE